VGNVARSNELIYTDKDTIRPVAGISVWEGSGRPNAVESVEGAMPLPRKFLEFYDCTNYTLEHFNALLN